ncbi:hypothetical protein Tco_0952385 [Tanacetum coccineum]|uniref:Uncharacterized protein n=1 Tax=Tanacetum coccineum TaxID=301880 RepID=A0ABQ5DWT5_9ASTR
MSQEQRQQAARGEKLVPSADRVKISTTNMRIEPIVPQKEETFQVVLGICKASPCFKAFTITADVPEIYMQKFWFTVKKTKKTPFYEFGLAGKKFSVYVGLFRKILDICLRVPNEDFVSPPSEEDLLAFLIELGYKGPLDHLTRMKNVDYPELIWEDLAYQIDYRQGNLRRREIMPYLRFTKIIINHLLSLNPSIPIPDQSQKLKVIFTTSSEGTGTKPGVLDEVKDSSEAKGDSAIDWGSKEDSEYSEENKVDEEIEWVFTDEEEEKQDDQDDDHDRSIDIEKTYDEEEIDDEFVHGDEYVHGNVDEEMKDAKVAKTMKDDEEITDTEKTDAENTEVTKGDLEQAGKLPLTSSSLSVSSDFGNQFLNLSSDTYLIGTTKESTDTEINSLLYIQIQQEVPHIQSPSILIIPVLMIPEPIVLSPIPEIPTVTSVTTLPPPPFVTNITLVVQELKQVDHVTLFIIDYSIFDLATTKDMPRRKWSDMDKRRSGIMVDLIDKQMLERRILRNLERLVDARELEIDYRLM